MTIEQTVEIPANRWIQMPASVPEGKARVLIEFPITESRLETDGKEHARTALAVLRGLYEKEAAVAGSFLDRKHAEKEAEYKLEDPGL
jgi:hypothetical protein